MLWKKSYEAGHETVDAQHKELFRLVQDVLDADSIGGRKEKIEVALKFLGDYAVRHFELEESLMVESNYPEYESHKQIHETFLKDVTSFVAKFQEEGSTVSVSQTINDFVITWLQEHIMGSDKKMAEFYKKFKGA